MSASQKREGEEHLSTKGEARRQDLILAAYRLLTERGFEGLRVREVAAEVEINSATLHYYFPTKDDLILAVGEYLLQQFLTVTAPLPEGYQDTPDQQLLQVFRDMRYQLEQIPELLVALNELHTHAQRDSAVRALLQRLNSGWHAHLASICTAGIEQHLFRADLDADHIASLIIALLKGISVQQGSRLDSFDLERIGAEIVGSLAKKG